MKTEMGENLPHPYLETESSQSEQFTAGLKVWKIPFLIRNFPIRPFCKMICHVLPRGTNCFAIQRLLSTGTGKSNLR